ncbi:mitochondrial intermembrane space import and assembly protein 40-B [Hylaeus volcanicus]|uniref:mitochondrial intermembrane space import and assembly protein 40-B n=1 Tax=Hylaeus volcanicus TaxID=313075 RepID=UPI0023B81CDB|nr:mitochondrial intermembrane space import and assembly protein 40-B [Hylaeus volcanicus]
MSLTHKEGKDTIIFASKEDHATPSTIELPEPEPSPGLLLPNGEINWNCPCLGGMATGPCGLEFREAFSCFHYSTAETKGSDCYEAFKTMQVCMTQYPALYGSKDTNLDDIDEDMEDEEHVKNTKASSGTHEQLEPKKEERTDSSSTKNKVERSNDN